MLRFAPRHVTQTVYDFTVAAMNDLGWTGPTPPFGAAPVTFQSAPVADSQDGSRLQPNMVAIYPGVEPPPEGLELGGPLSSQLYPFFAEVYGENTGMSTSIASDIRDIWLGRRGNSVLQVMDYSQTPPEAVVGWYIDLGVNVERGPLQGKFNFQVVTAYAEIVYTEGSFVA